MLVIYQLTSLRPRRLCFYQRPQILTSRVKGLRLTVDLLRQKALRSYVRNQPAGDMLKLGQWSERSSFQPNMPDRIRLLESH